MNWFLDLILGRRPVDGICEDARSFRRLLLLRPRAPVVITVRNNNYRDSIKGVAVYAPSWFSDWEWQSLSRPGLLEVFPGLSPLFGELPEFSASQIIELGPEIHQALRRPVTIERQSGHGDRDQATMIGHDFGYPKAA